MCYTIIVIFFLKIITLHVSPSNTDRVVYTSDNDYTDIRWVVASGGNGTGIISSDTGNFSLGVDSYFKIRNIR